MKEILIGAHLPFKKPKYFLGTLNGLMEIKGNVAALFVGTPQSKVRSPLDDEMIKNSIELAKSNGIYLDQFIVHAPYIVNLGTSNAYLRKISIELMITDIKRTNSLGIRYFNIHPGSNVNLEEGINLIARSINEMISKTEDVIILLETTVNRGNNIGGKFEHLSKIIKLIENKNRIGVCFDTVHTWDAGYDTKNNLNEVLDEFDKIIGLNYLKGFHVSDSKNISGSNMDRHERIGKGKLGLPFFRELVRNERINHLPFILEVPYESLDDLKEDIRIIVED